MSQLTDSVCPCGRSPDPGILPGGGCVCSVPGTVSHFKVRGPDGSYYRRRFATPEEAEDFIRGLYVVAAFNGSGKVLWTEGN